MEFFNFSKNVQGTASTAAACARVEGQIFSDKARCLTHKNGGMLTLTWFSHVEYDVRVTSSINWSNEIITILVNLLFIIDKE